MRSRICERCQAEVPAPRVLCRCGGRLRKVEPRLVKAPEAEQKVGWHEVGKFVGSKVTGGSSLGVFVGGLIGRVLEGDLMNVRPDDEVIARPSTGVAKAIEPQSPTKRMLPSEVVAQRRRARREKKKDVR